MSHHLKVAVRVRPLSQQEIAVKSEKIVKVHNSTTISVVNSKVPLENAGDSRERVRLFSFDYCYDESSTQDEIFSMVSVEIGNALQNKYHSSVLAYGQSSTGKTHTMTGSSDYPGLIPRLCTKVFQYIREEETAEFRHKETVVSYLEIYNEKVQDLLIEDDKFTPLKVREHPKKGPYVQGLSEHAVQDAEDLLKLFGNGNLKRRVAATPNNRKSSRSHSLFTITCNGGVKLHLVDLAGSERAGSRCRTTSSFKEGANINKSLVALGNVISVLAEHAGRICKQNRKRFVPYRDSVLTWLLKDTLGGNSKTVMIATVSPSHLCYNETVNTLRFGQRAKQIITQPIVNEDVQEKTIRELRVEIARLRQLLADNQIPNQIQKIDVCLSTSSLNAIDDSAPQSEQQSPTSIPLTPSVCSSNEFEKTLPTVIFKQTDILLPVIDVRSSVSNVKVSNPKIRLNKKDYIKMDDKRKGTIGSHENLPAASYSAKAAEKLRKLAADSRKSSFGSQETLPGINIAKAAEKHRKLMAAESRKSSFGSQETLPGTTEKQRKLLADSRKHSTDKVYVRTLMRKASEIGLKKAINGNIPETKTPPRTPTDIKSPPLKSDSKSDTHKKVRSDIVAAVTSRLYAKGKKKETGGDTMEEPATPVEEPHTPAERTLPELQLCNNARLRLREFSKLALKASKRFVNKEIQTESPVVARVKEQSTDVLDLAVVVQEVKDASVTAETETRDIGIGSESSLIPSDFDSPLHAFTLTRTCGTQITAKEEEDATAARGKDETPKYTPISFTKYLQARHQPPKFEIIDHATANPIYTNSVNINVSHNYITRNRIDGGGVSDDSLDNTVNQQPQQQPTACSSTPDLISNHNSLEHNLSHVSSSSSSSTQVAQQLENQASTSAASSLKKKLMINHSSQTMLPETEVPSQIQYVPLPNFCLAQCSLVPRNDDCDNEKNIPVSSSITSLLSKEPIQSDLNRGKINLSESIQYQSSDLLKSIMKPNTVDGNSAPPLNFINPTEPCHYFSDSSEHSASAGAFSDAQDSLKCHSYNRGGKKVRFSRYTDRETLMTALCDLLEEASALVLNLTMAANRLEASSSFSGTRPSADTALHDLQVTVNDLKDSAAMAREFSKQRQTGDGGVFSTTACNVTPKKSYDRDAGKCFGDTYTQTPPLRKNTFVQTTPEIKLDSFAIPENKWEFVVQQSCDKLAQCINAAIAVKTTSNPQSAPRSFPTSQHLHQEMSPFDEMPGNDDSQPLSLISNWTDDSNFETRTFSDYGSLPRRERSSSMRSTCSPRAYLKQLTALRKQVIENSRSNLNQSESKLHL